MPWWGWIVVGAVLLGGRALRDPDRLLSGLPRHRRRSRSGAIALRRARAAAVGAVGDSSRCSPSSRSCSSAAGCAARLRRSVTRADDTLVGEHRRRARGDRGRRAAGRIELRGSTWSARNVGDAALEPGDRASRRTRRRPHAPRASRLLGRADGNLDHAFSCIVVLVIIVIARTATVVPQQSAYVVERLGKFSRTLLGRLPHPGAVRRAHRLQALAEGSSRSTSRSRSASRATTCRCTSTACST